MSAAEETIKPLADKKARTKSTPFLNRTLDFLSSVRFGVVQLCILVLLSMTGMIIIQQNVNGFDAYFASLTPAEKIVWNNNKAEIQKIESGELTDINLYNNLSKKPNHLNISEAKEQIQNSQVDIERRNYEVAVEKKYSTLVLPFVITLFTAPFALSLGRKGRVATVGYAIGIWLLFMGINSAFEQFGLNGIMSAKIAVWSPILFFSMVGVFLISRVKT